MIRVYLLLCLLISAFFTTLKAQTTSWKGTYSTSWRNASNWTNGIPTATTDAIIGDAAFTGLFQPNISGSSVAKSVTIGGVRASALSMSRSLTVSGNINILSNGTLTQGKTTITLTGNWTNNGTYINTSTGSNVVMAGIAQTIGGTVTTSFRKLTVNAGSTVTLARALIISGTSSVLTVKGTFHPGESPTYLVSATAITVNANAILKVYASTFAGNYAAVTTTIDAAATVEYGAAGSQTVTNSLTYGTLRISGSGTKTLAGNLPALASSSGSVGNIYVAGGTLDLSTFTAARGTSVPGGAFTVANGATLRIGGTNTFPANYGTRTLDLNSTVEYAGTAQSVATNTYGNLTLSSSSGAAVKTMPAAALTITGNLTTTTGSGTSVSFTAAAALAVGGSVTIGTSTSIDAGSFAHSFAGNCTNNGTFTGNTSTVSFTGAGSVISGSGAYNFNNLTIAASNVTAAAATALTVAGNFATTGAGIFTHLPGGTVTFTGTTKTISGTGITLDNVSISGSLSTASSITITGNLAVGGSLSHTAGIITLSGASKTLSGTGTKSFFGLSVSGSVTTAVSFSIASSLAVSGSLTATAGNVTFTGTSSLNGTANLFDVTLNGTSLQLGANAVLGIAGVYTVSAGTLNVTSTTPNTVAFNGSTAQNVNGGTYHHLSLQNGNTKTAVAAITANGNITIGTGTTFSAGSFTHVLNGNWVNQGTFTPGAGTITLAGNQPVSISGGTTFGILTLNKTNAATTVSLLSNVSVATLNTTNGLLQTGSNTLTITTTRNGGGIILGNIQRTHAFAAGTAYAFESPDNTITFSSITVAVTSVTVSVTKNSIADFPFGSAVNRQYNISIPVGSYTAVLRLHYEDDELNGNAETTMPLWDFNGSIWVNAGKTASSNTSNYVELSGLANIATRWTLSDAANVLRWTGAVSSDWGTPGNWTVVQGSPGAVPGMNDIVQIGTVAIPNQPVITTAVSVKSIQFGSAQAATLTLGSGGSLTTSGNISGTWSANATHTINVGSQSLVVNGDLVLSDGTAGHAINLSIGTGSVTTGGTLTQSGGAAVAFTGAGTLSIGGHYQYTSGTFTAGAGTVIYNGANAQTMAGLNYNNITINKSAGIASVNTAIAATGNLSLQGGMLDLQANATIAGNTSIATGTVLNSGAVTTTTGGNWTNNGSFTPGAGTVVFNGTGAQAISATTFANLTINKTAGTATLTGNAVINSDLTLTAGSLDMGSFTASRSSAGGTLTIANGASLLVGGPTNFPASYTGYNLGAASTVQYNGPVAQTVAPVTYGHLLFANGGANAKTLSGPTTVNGDLTISNGATFNAGTQTLGLGGNWVNNGSFVPATSTILLNGAAKTIAGNTAFNRLTVYGSYTVNGSDITYNGSLNITSTGVYDAGAGTATVNGDLTNSGSLTSNGITTFTGTSVQTIRFLNAVVSNSTGVINFNGNVSPVLNSTSTPTFANLNVNNTAGVNPSVNWLVLGNFTIGSGAIFNGGAPTHTIRGNFTNNGMVTSSGTLLFNPPAAVNISLGSAFSSTGTLLLGGTGAITLTGTPTSLQTVDIENTNAAGITPPGGWTLNGDFVVGSNSIFHAGGNTFTVTGDVESNGTLDGGTSTFIMNGTGSLVSAGAGTLFHHFTVAGNIIANTDFQVGGNFTNNGTIDATASAVIMTGSNPASIGGTTNPSPLAQLTVDKAYNVAVTLARNLSEITSLHVSGGILDAGSFTMSQDAVNFGELTIEDSAVLKIGGTNTLPLFNTYTLDTLSTVDYNGSVQAIAAGVNYGNLTISAAGAKAPSGSLTILHDFTLANGTFTGGSFTHFLGGDWTMTSGTFTNGGTTIQLNGLDSQFIRSTGDFSNLTVNKTAGLAILGTNVGVSTNLTFTAGKLWLSAGNLTLAAAAGITGADATHYIIADSTGSLILPIGAGAGKTFPVGTMAQYIPATVSLTAGSTADNISVRVLDSAYSNGLTGIPVDNNAVNATWFIGESVAGGSNATVTLQWPGVLELPGFIRSLSRLAQYAGGNWNYGPSDLAATGTDPYSLVRTGFTALSTPFSVSTFLALPVTWVNINGNNTGDDNLITWTTANETDNSYFVVEVSADGVNWTEAGRERGMGGSSREQYYAYLHRNVPYTTAYYRIKQVDRNGRYSYSKIIRLVKDQENRSGFMYVATPSGSRVTALIQATRLFATNVVMVDAAGRMVQKKYIQFFEGSNVIDFHVDGLLAGVYFLQYVDEKGNRQVAKWIKQ